MLERQYICLLEDLNWTYALSLCSQIHQESNYMTGFGTRLLNHHFAVFTKSDSANGAMSVLKGSHKSGSFPYIKSKTDRIKSYVGGIR